MRALTLCLASLSFSASAQAIRQTPSATESSIVLVQNGSEAGAPLVADAVDSVTIAIAIRDDAGEPIADLPIRIDVTGSRNIVTPASLSFTDANGLFIANLTTTAAETKTIRVLADAGRTEMLLLDRPSVTFRAGPATHVDVARDGDANEVTLTARDFFGNVAAEYRVTIQQTAVGH